MNDPEIPPPTDDTKMWAMFTHLSALSGLLGIPFGHIVGPLIIWLIKRDNNPVLDAHGKEALNFQISWMIYAIVSGILILVLIGIVLLPVVLLINLILTIVGAVKASKGELYHYPLTIRFIT
jgi:uncharacterized Tic20 family protein